MNQQQLLGLFVVGLAAGGLGALLGVGGGLIIVPALSLLAGLSLHAAIGTSLVCICASSAASAAVYLRRGRVELPVAVELQFFSVAGAV
ncbi:MAG: TSUP family transporter, partial [Gemmatimonadetes bacterium]|nr:TSUP family transporter [Gemmatimonadota bacterium]